MRLMTVQQESIGLRPQGKMLGMVSCWLVLVWLGTNASVVALDSAPSPLTIEGYTGQVSYQPGQELTLHVSTTAANFAIEIARLGAERQVVLEQAGIAGQSHTIPENASSHGCGWPTAWKVNIPAEWRSGYYQVTLRARDGGGKYTHRGTRTAESSCFFIVRSAEPGKSSRVLLQLSTNTYNAYNNWGGFSLYAYNGLAGVQGHRVSFHRPPSSQFGNWEQPFVAWAEGAGYQLDYAANNDLELHPEELKAYRLVLSVGHDEYWSAGMRDQLEQFITQGGNVAFFSGNTCCWQVRNEENGIAQTCWKQRYVMDPLYPSGKHGLLSTLWSHHLVDRPENQLTGVGFLFGGYHRSHDQFMDGSGAYQVHRPRTLAFRRDWHASGNSVWRQGYDRRLRMRRMRNRNARWLALSHNAGWHPVQLYHPGDMSSQMASR
jgi:hypothetical protein